VRILDYGLQGIIRDLPSAGGTAASRRK